MHEMHKKIASKTFSFNQQKRANTSSHLLLLISQIILNKLNKLSYATLPHPPYLPDLLTILSLF